MRTNTGAVETAISKNRVNTMDLVSLLLVVVITLVAILLGIFLRNSVESRTTAYTDPAGVSIFYPETWQLNSKDADNGVVKVSNALEGGVPTTLGLQRVAVSPSASLTGTLTLVANDLAVNRSRSLNAFKILSTAPNQTVQGMPATRVSYVYVATPSSTLRESLPVVVLGDDYLVRKGGTVYVFSLTSTEANYKAAWPIFQKFVDSAKLP